MSSERNLVPMPDEVKFQLQKTILPIVATTTDGGFHLIGTGFIVAALGRQAILLSAAHNFSQIARIDKPYDRYHPTTPNEFRSVLYRDQNLKRTRMYALFRESETKMHHALIQNAYVNNPCDIAACSIFLEDDVPAHVWFDKKLAIDTTPPKKDAPITAAGYSNMTLRSHNVNYDVGTMWAMFEQRLEWRHGSIADIFPSRGPRNQPWPCFRTDVPFDAGMSGGPIFDKRYGDLLVACGIVCSDSTAGTSMRAGSGLDAIASMLWPAMGIAIKHVKLDGVDTEVRLLEFQRRNFIDDKGDANSHIRFIPGERADDFQMQWV